VIGYSGRAVAGAVVVLAIGLGGCAQGPTRPASGGNVPVRVRSASPSALAAPSAAPSTRERSRRGAEEFVRYWFRTLDYATQTGDVAALTAASDAHCRTCDAALSVVRNSYSDGGYLQGGTYTVRAVNSEEFALDDRPVASVTFDRTSRSGFGPDGQVRDSLPAAAFVSCEVTLDWAGDHWIVANVVGDPLPT
jgi:hypothetical protein